MEPDDDGDDTVEVVVRAVSTDVGDAATTAADDEGIMLITNGDLDGEFLVSTDATATDAERVYSYDSDDIFIDSTEDEGVEITMASFVAKIKDGGNMIQVIAYDVDGTSIFRLTG